MLLLCLFMCFTGLPSVDEYHSEALLRAKVFENPCRNDGRVGLKVHYIAAARHLHPGTCSISVSRMEGPNRLFSCLSGPLKTEQH